MQMATIVVHFPQHTGTILRIEDVKAQGEYMMIAASHEVRIEDAKGKVIAMVLAMTSQAVLPLGTVRSSSTATATAASFRKCRVLFKKTQLLTSRAEADLPKEERGRYVARSSLREAKAVASIEKPLTVGWY